MLIFLKIFLSINIINIKTELALKNYTKDVGQFKEGENINNELTRWYINTETNECETFQYRGTGGNFNNFRTQIECKRHFDNPISDKIEGCQDQPEIIGACNPNSVSNPGKDLWSWDRATASCITFKYSGCGGNKNRYDSKDECEAFCYNDDKHYGNPSNTVTLDKIKKEKYAIPNYHDCHLKPDLQKGKADIKAIALIKKKQCVYAAAGLSQDDKKIRGAFNTINECVQKCFPYEYDAADTNEINQMKQKIPACSRVQPDQYIKPAEGDPSPDIRFYYDHSNKGCSRFESWPGEFVDAKNNFPSAEICESYCGWDKTLENGFIKREPVCLLPKAGEYSPTENINGNLNVKRWYFDSSENNFKCTSFMFGGLNGNGNNFKSKEACKVVCWEHMDPDEVKFEAKDENMNAQDDKQPKN